jgi:hypothetical protein
MRLGISNKAHSRTNLIPVRRRDQQKMRSFIFPAHASNEKANNNETSGSK